jgi:serine/threonine protein kinase
MLKAFSTKRHKNLVKLLATYRYRGDYYLLFPWAEKNLREYWQTTPVPEFTDTTLSWSLHQCKAIASALHVIHENRTTAESREARAALHAARFGIAGSSTEVDDRLFGRHGDLKPENILFSMEDVEDDNGISHAQGLLLIADFGLCELHRKMTRSKILADRITGSATYVPPEAKSSKHINRKYDIWSLGCVYLEYVTWLLQGWEALNRFSEQRAQTAQDNINDDTFFTITGNTTTLRKGVQDHIKALHDDPRCSTFIHDFLDLISGGMLVANPAKRWESGQVNARLFTMLDRWKKDLFYLSKAGLERPKRSSTIFSTNSSLSEAPKKGSPLPTRQSTAMSGQSVVTASQQVGFALERTLSPTGYRN